jgi:hypothetical protein
MYVPVCVLLLQLGGLGWEGYWKNGWNKFDLLLLGKMTIP